MTIFSKTFKFPGLAKSLLYGLADKCGTDVDIEGSGGEFTLSGDKEQVLNLAQEALYHCSFQSSPS